MTKRTTISTCIARFFLSLVLLGGLPLAGHAQLKLFRIEKDSIPVFRGFSVSFDLVGPAMLILSDHGEIEGALRINLHDQLFPVVEIGIGKANHKQDEITGISYETKAPYFRIGLDLNLLKATKRHGPNHVYGGVRYAFTSYKVDIAQHNLHDPLWLWDADFSVEGMKCNMHWLELVLGIDAKIVGPLHLGWNLRYKRRLSHKDGDLGTTWYVPGFGINDKDQIAANFNVIIDI